MLIGIAAGILTGALWGLTFVAARAVVPFTAWDITVLRYGLFGLVSLGLIVLPPFRPRGMTRRRFGLGFVLGALCYPGYFLTVAFAVHRAGPTIPPLIVGLMPVVLAIIGNLRDRSVPWSALRLPLGLIGLGVLVVNGGSLGGQALGSGTDVLVGSGWALLALATWVAFGAVNAVVMQAENAPGPMAWTCVQGLGALAGSAALLPMTGLIGTEALHHVFGTAEGLRFLAWGIVMGIGGSWFAAWAWIVAAQRLPLAFAAQLVVFETVFGLLDGFIYEHRWPTAVEWTGSALQIAGVVVSIGVFTRPRRPASAVVLAGACQPR